MRRDQGALLLCVSTWRPGRAWLGLVACSCCFLWWIAVMSFGTGVPLLRSLAR